MVADSFRSEQEGCAELALVWKHAKEGKGNYYEVHGYLFHRDKILGESIRQLIIPKCRRTEVLRLAHNSVFSSHMGPKKTLERIKYSLFWEGLRSNVKKFCESCKECQLTRSVRIKDRSPITPVARPELPFQVVNMDLIGPIDPPSSKGHTYILCLVDQHTRWGEAMPGTSVSAKITCEALLSIFSRTEIYLLLKREGFVENNSAASWVTVLDLWKWYFCRSLTKKYAACVMPFDIYMTKKVRFKIEYTSYGCNLTAQVLRMLEQFVISRIVDIDLLMQIWKNRVKQINFVLEWVRWVGSEIIPAKGKLEPGVLEGYWTRGGGPVGGASSLGTWLLEDFLEKGFRRRESLPIGCWEVGIMAQMASRGEGNCWVLTRGRNLPKAFHTCSEGEAVATARITAHQVANQFLAASGKQISRETVARRLRGGGVYARRPIVCVPLTRQHRTARLQWCREHRNWTEQNWACVLFSDESRFSLSSDCRRQLIWRESGTAYPPENIQEKDRYPTCSIMVWAGIMINGRTRLHVVANGTMMGQRCIDEVLLPHVRLFHGAVGDKFVFMDDNATCHRTLAVQDCLDSEGIQRLVWPARSPDLNPIENVWDALGRQVAGRNYPPTNKNTLIRALTEEWDKLPQQLLDNVVQNMFKKELMNLSNASERIKCTAQKLKKNSINMTLEDVEEAFDLFYKKVMMAMQYSPKCKLRNDVMLIKSEKSLVVSDNISESFDLENDCDGYISMHTVKGSHKTFI
ncbi:transposable element Tcb2 transposase [Trichonephila clavipes]|uniref:RNA-directed DNA polymerase n=1 Tax=Trichonephila clavipes TaxID=2585209 RepID=A0A8X6VI21_TRICX|nr:transposable element Tcb2 transposase [Trichonephila clavipes]